MSASNLYAGRCAAPKCDKHVPAKAGMRLGGSTYCLECAGERLRQQQERERNWRAHKARRGGRR